MDDDLRSQLFDPSDSRALAVAHRPADCSAVTAVVSDVVWLEFTATAAGATDSAMPSTWSCCRANSGDTTSVGPGMSSAGTW